MQQSPYVTAVPTIVAQMREGKEDDDDRAQPRQTWQPPDQGAQTVYVYRTADGKLVFSDTLIADEEPEAPIIDNVPPAPTNRKAPPFYVIVLLLLCLFLFLDSADT